MSKRLRQETRAEHDAVEATLDWEARASDRDSYRDWLERLYQFHRLWEPAAAGALDDPSFFDPRRKLHLLADDVARLGGDVSVLNQSRQPGASFAFASVAEALGSMYVLEGSMLGGKLIARHVTATLGHAPAYHDAYGSRTGAMWRDFQQRLATIPPCQADAAVAAATTTFSRIRAWLVRASPEVPVARRPWNTRSRP